MKAARVFTWFGCIALVASAIFHATGYPHLLRMIQSGSVHAPLDGLLKATWLLLSIQFLVMAVMAVYGCSISRGGKIVLLCASYSAVTAVILYQFLGLFPGVYLLFAVTDLLAIGGWLQMRQRLPEVKV
jgi:hypothetical protein